MRLKAAASCPTSSRLFVVHAHGVVARSPSGAPPAPCRAAAGSCRARASGPSPARCRPRSRPRAGTATRRSAGSRTWPRPAPRNPARGPADGVDELRDLARRHDRHDRVPSSCRSTPTWHHAVDEDGQRRRGVRALDVIVAVDASYDDRDARGLVTSVPTASRRATRTRVRRRCPAEVPRRRVAEHQERSGRRSRPTAITMTVVRACPDRRQPLERPGAHRPFLERVPDAVHGADEPRLVPVLAELAADPGDVRVDDAAARVVAVAPDPVHQLVAREDDAGVAGEGEQDLELERGEADLARRPPLTRRRLGSITSPLRSIGPVSRSACIRSIRRRIAFTRAASSRRLKGFVR